MVFILFMIKSFFRISSFLAPKMAGKWAFNLFQKPHRKKIRDRELEIFDEFEETRIPAPEEDLFVYLSGNQTSYPVVLIHGWESGPGSMLGIARELVKKNNRVIVLGLPAHGRSKLKKTNMLHSSKMIQILLHHFQLKSNFSMISHSFGSGVITTALKDQKIQLDKLVFLTTPDRIMDIFSNYAKMIGLGEKALKEMITRVENISPFSMKEFNISEMISRVRYRKMLLIHDQNDSVLPFTNALAIKEKNPEIILRPTLDKGHYRLLWDQEIIDLVTNFLGE